LIRELVQRDLEVYVLAPDYSEEVKMAVRSLGAQPLDYPLNRTGLNPLHDLVSFYALRAHLVHLKPDVVLSYAIKPVVYGMLAAKMTRVPRRAALVAGLGHAFTKEGSSKRSLLQTLMKFLYKYALSHAHKVFFQNPDDLRELVTLGMVAPEKALYIGGTGVLLEEWYPAPSQLHPITFTLVARLLREKGIVEFAEAARRVKAKYPWVRFLLVGGMDANPGRISRAEVETWVQEGILEWAGQVADVRPYLAQTSVFVLPSYYREGIPRSIQEAMAMARPVITTDAPGCRETVVEGVNGYLVPPRNVEALVKAMERFIAYPYLIERMGRESRRLAEERFDAIKLSKRLADELLR